MEVQQSVLPVGYFVILAKGVIWTGMEKVREVVQLVLLMTKMMAMTTSMTMLFSGMVP